MTVVWNGVGVSQESETSGEVGFAGLVSGTCAGSEGEESREWLPIPGWVCGCPLTEMDAKWAENVHKEKDHPTPKPNSILDLESFSKKDAVETGECRDISMGVGVGGGEVSSNPDDLSSMLRRGGAGNLPSLPACQILVPGPASLQLLDNL